MKQSHDIEEIIKQIMYEIGLKKCVSDKIR